MKIIAIDGPAGSGKSSLCAEVSKRLEWSHINTGTLYRAFAYALAKSNLNIDELDPNVLEEKVQHFLKDLVREHKNGRLFYQKEDISLLIKHSQVGQGASKVAKNPLLRKLLLPIQKQWVIDSEAGALVEGRDIGTVLFPDADIKFFVTADLKERAKRRRQQLQASNSQNIPDLKSLEEQIKKRDEQDAARGAAPLIKAEDAVVFDTSNKPFEDCVLEMIELIKEV